MSTAGNGHPLCNLARFLACTSIGKTNVLDPEELQSILFHRVDASGSLWGERPSRSVKDQASNRTLLRVNSLLEKLKVSGETRRCPNWVLYLRSNLAALWYPHHLLQCLRFPLFLCRRQIPLLLGHSWGALTFSAFRRLVGTCGTIWRYAVAEQHAWSGQQEKGVRSLMCRCCLLSVFNYASGDNCCGISWVTTEISLQGWHTEEEYWVALFSQRGCDTCLPTRWRHGLPLSGGCQLPQQALPPHLLLITAGGHEPAEWLLMLKRSPGSKISGLPSSTIALPEGSFLAGLVVGYSAPPWLRIW